MCIIYCTRFSLALESGRLPVCLRVCAYTHRMWEEIDKCLLQSRWSVNARLNHEMSLPYHSSWKDNSPWEREQISVNVQQTFYWLGHGYVPRERVIYFLLTGHIVQVWSGIIIQSPLPWWLAQNRHRILTGLMRMFHKIFVWIIWKETFSALRLLDW